MSNVVTGVFDRVTKYVASALMPAQNDAEADSNDEGVRRFGYRVLMILFVLVVVWGGLAPIQSAALAPGVVTVEGNATSVQHLEGGLALQILVGNGDRVSEGQDLVLMDSAKSLAETKILEGKLFAVEAKLSRLAAERDELADLTFSSTLLESASSDLRAQAAVKGEEALFRARLDTRTGEVAVLEQKITQLHQRRLGLIAIRDSKKYIAESIEQEVNDLTQLLAEGYVDSTRLRDLERSRSSVLGELSDSETQIATIDVAVIEAELEILQLKKRFRTEVVVEFQESSEKAYDLEQQYQVYWDRLTRSRIKSPVDGYVLGLALENAGSVVSPGEEIMKIVPINGQLVVEARVSPMDVDRVRIGQQAEIRFAVFKDPYLVSGTLTKLSHDRLIDDATGTPYFLAEIEIESGDLSLLGDAQLTPGMPAEVLIKTGARTMLGYITSPMNRLFARALTEA